MNTFVPLDTKLVRNEAVGEQIFVIETSNHQFQSKSGEELVNKVGILLSAKAALDEKGQILVLLDLKSVDMLNSDGLRCILCAATTLRKHGGDLYLCGVKPSVRIIFEITGLDRAIAIFDSVQSWFSRDAAPLSGFTRQVPTAVSA